MIILHSLSKHNPEFPAYAFQTAFRIDPSFGVVP